MTVNPEVTITLDHHSRKILPKNGEKNVLITSALPYCNNIPHLGNIIGCVLSADVYARYCRLRGYNTLYVCGTDEYGTATETKALEEKLTCKEVCDKYLAFHEETYKWFNIDFDYFGRTSTELQKQITQKIYLELNAAGKIEEQTITQLYCEKHESFLADRFVEGTCPKCSYADARGDQCDGCGSLLDPMELINPRCKVDGATPVERQSRQLFLNLTDLQERLEAWVDKAIVEGGWSANSIAITKSWLKRGLLPRCITRDLKWGVPVPRQGYESKVFYVWFDAPIGYLSITANYTDQWEQWWKESDLDIKLYQFIGKDNVPFHSVMFPSSLIGTGEKYTLVHHLSTTEYLQYEDKKFSKSRGVGVFGNNVAESKIPCDVWRYYLLSNRPETSDTQFNWESFLFANNSELLANLGNLVNRIMKFTNSKYQGVVPALPNDGTSTEEIDIEFVAKVNELLGKYIEEMETVKSIRQGLKLVMEISSVGNGYLQGNKLDNKLFENQRSRCDTVINLGVNVCYLISALVCPFLPVTSEAILRQLKAPTRRITDTWTGKDISGGHAIGKAEYLFVNMEVDERAKELRAKYSGNAAAAPAPVKKGKAAKGAALLSEAPAGIEKTPQILSLESTIKSKGEEVRSLKESKADKEAITAAVTALNAAKEELTNLIKGLQIQ